MGRHKKDGTGGTKKLPVVHDAVLRDPLPNSIEEVFRKDNPLPPKKKQEQYKEPVIDDVEGFFEEPHVKKVESQIVPVYQRNGEHLDPLLETSLQQEIESESNIKSVSKELFSHQNIDLKTEVSHDEINNITRLQFLKHRFGIQNIDVLTDTFLRLRVSKQRKSRQEFISALQTENRNAQGGGLIGKLGNMFGGNGGNNNNP